MLRIGVIGVGRVGKEHSRILSSLPEVELAAVVDLDSKKSREIADSYLTQSFTDYQDIYNKVDAVIVASTTASHFEIARNFLARGIHTFVEKPICTSVEEATKLVRIAEKKKIVLQVGHVERYNPSVIEAQKYIRNPKFIETQRLGPFEPRMANVGVVLDLMIHDIDIVLSLNQAKITHIDAIGTSVFTKYEDIAKARIQFGNGCLADFTASRITFGQARKIRIFQPDAYISLDYAKQKLKIYRKKKEKISSLKDIKVLKPRLKKLQPLEEELKDFISCIGSNRRPRVGGQPARDALEVALEIVRKIK